ncbi:hypothetical protein ACJIZ3_022113 [Penstemon smallii]|uniref:Uncharacterized protein n=1 Tax=Penstemon smallii TaxID=265156 RepID=A0ABD3SND3_9LAMI
MMSYLTNVWKIGFTRAAAIVNAFWGLVAALPLFLKFTVDSIIGNYWMLLISSIAYTIIIPLDDDESESDDEDDNDGILWEEEQLVNIPPEELQEAFNETTSWRFHIIIPSFVVGTIVAVIALFYIKPWSLRFGIPAICTLVATLLFLSGSWCLDKAAIVMPTKPLEEQEKNKWRLCRVTEVEETKTIIRMIPVWMTFILCGVVSAIGFTFFIEQLNHLNPKVGRLKVPIVALLYSHEQAQNKFAKFYAKFAASLGQSGSRKLAPSIGIAVSMVLGILCCITAAKVENRRLGVVIKHGLVDKPDERVPMTMFWLLPQFVLLGGFTGVFKYSAVSFFADQSPISTRNYLPFFVSAVFGVGTLGSVLSVYVVGKVSEKGGKKNWFQHDLNGSRLDKYYWTLAWLMAVNLVVFIVVAILYRYKESELEDQQGEEFGGIDEPSLSDENPKCFCFCP